jgi:hypothetical protein
MPTPRLTDEQCQEAWDAYVNCDMVATAAAQALGLGRNAYNNRLVQAKVRGFHLSEGAKRVVTRAGLTPREARGGWIHDYDSDGKKVGTTRWAVENDSAEQDVLDRIRDAFEGLTPAAPVSRPADTQADLCNVLPLYDVHWGMAAWGKETGDQDYDLTLARDDLMRGLDTILMTAPKANTCVMLLGGDFLHADDDNGQTPASKHPLDVASRQFMAIDTGITILKYAVTRVLEHHDNVVIRVLRGNHDPNSHRTISFALREWLANNDRATVDMTPNELFMFQWGRSGVFGQHGDKMKPVDLALKLSDVCRFWTESPHRYAYTGHKHSMAAQRIGGLNWERLEPFAPSDVYGASWVNRRAMKMDTYHKQRGRVGTIMDPMERE